MSLGMRLESPCHQRLGSFLVGLLLALSVPRPGAAQALHVERLAGGTELVLVSLPLSEATTVTWPAGDGAAGVVTSGDLTLAADLETRLGGLETAPPVVVAVGGAVLGDLRGVLERSLAGRVVATQPVSPPQPEGGLAEGGVERRLGRPGDEAMVRLELPLPPPGDFDRTTVEVLFEMLPTMLAARMPGLTSRVSNGVEVLSRTVDAQLAEVALRELRLQLARLAAAPELDGDRAEQARQRVEVRRLAELGSHPAGAEQLLRLWQEGDVAAIRERLFGAAGVTVASLREAAARWLPVHPGRGVLVLPPRVFNPRFAPGATTVQLDNDAMAAILERPGAGLAVVVLRPVLAPDLEGGLAEEVLARLAAEVRASGMAPGWVRVGQEPPLLELAAPPDSLPEVLEALQPALERVAGDDQPVARDRADARLRALVLMAPRLGLGAADSLTPAVLLRPSNLALGVVAPDEETALEAIRKFTIGGASPTAATSVGEVAPTSRSREAVPGDESALVVDLELDAGVGEVLPQAVRELLRSRSQAFGDELGVELLEPLVPGRQVLLLVAHGELPLSEVERRLREAWPRLTGPVKNDELEPLRRRLAAMLTAEGSGPLGAARRCAAVAAGAAVWRGISDLEMEALGLSGEEVNRALTGLGPWSELATSGAGVLPLPATGERAP